MEACDTVLEMWLSSSEDGESARATMRKKAETIAKFSLKGGALHDDKILASGQHLVALQRLKNAMRVLADYQIPDKASEIQERCDKIEAARAFLDMTLNEQVQGVPEIVQEAYAAGVTLSDALEDRAQLLRCAQKLSIQDDDLFLLNAHPGCASQFRIQKGQSDKELKRALEIDRKFSEDLGQDEDGNDKCDFCFRKMVERLALVCKEKKNAHMAPLDILGAAERVFVRELQLAEYQGLYDAAGDGDENKDLYKIEIDNIKTETDESTDGAEAAANDLMGICKDVSTDEITNPNKGQIKHLCFNKKSGSAADLETALNCTMPCPNCKKCIRGYASAMRNDCSDCKICLQCKSQTPGPDPFAKEMDESLISDTCSRCGKAQQCLSVVLPDDPLSGRNAPINFDLWWKAISHDLNLREGGEEEEEEGRRVPRPKFRGLEHYAMLSGLDMRPLSPTQQSRPASPARGK
jgi:hypothetical protein